MARRKIRFTPEQQARHEESARAFRAELAESERLTRLVDQALAQDDVAGLQAALDAGASPEVRDANGRVALSRAILRNAFRCADVLLEAFPQQADRGTQEGETPFACACSKGNATLAARLGPAAQRLAQRMSIHRRSGPVLYALRSGDAATMGVALAFGDFWDEAQKSLTNGYKEATPGLVPEAIDALFDSRSHAPYSPGKPGALDALLAWLAAQTPSEAWQTELQAKWESSGASAKRRMPASFPAFSAALERRELLAAAALGMASAADSDSSQTTDPSVRSPSRRL